MIYHFLLMIGGAIWTVLYLFLMIIFIGPNSFMALHESTSSRLSFVHWMMVNAIVLMVWFFGMLLIYKGW
jgi:hypothetical protein